jgi:hypothetical protein
VTEEVRIRDDVGLGQQECMEKYLLLLVEKDNEQ